MESRLLQDILIKIIGSELNETELDSTVKNQLDEDTVSDLYNLAKSQDLAHIVSSAFYRNNIKVTDELTAKFSKEEMISVYRNEQIKFTFTQICNLFKNQKISYIPLKGAVLRPYYPKENMRTSCDIDILIKEKDLKKAIKVLTSKGYKFEKKLYHDVSFYSPSGVHLELHFNILESAPNIDAVLKDAWDFAESLDDTRFKFTNEFFMFHIFAHAAHHFVSGGCGLKALMDIWVMEYKMGITYLDAKDLLKKAKIYQFAAKMTEVSNICFTGKEKSEFADILLDYIFEGGLYGTKENRIAIKKTQYSKLTYVFKRIFLSPHDMKVQFGILEKLPFLLPACWMFRLLKMLLPNKAKKVKNELKTVDNISDKKTEKIREMYSYLDL